MHHAAPGNAAAQPGALNASAASADIRRTPLDGPQHPPARTTPLEQRNVRVWGRPSFATLIKSALMAALPVASASGGASQGLLDDAVALLHHELGISKFMMLRDPEDPANVAGVNAALTGLGTPGRPDIPGAASALTALFAPVQPNVPGVNTALPAPALAPQATHLWVQGGAPEDPDAAGDRIAGHHRRDQTRELLRLISFGQAPLGDDTEDVFRAILADRSVRPGLFFTEHASTWDWARASKTKRQLAIIDNSGVPAWSSNPPPDPEDITAAHMLTHDGFSALFFTDRGAGGDQHHAARHYAAQGCAVITLPLLNGTNVTLVAPTLAREKLARFASQHADEGVHYWEPEPTSAWAAILGLGAAGAMLVAVMLHRKGQRSAPPGGTGPAQGNRKVRTVSARYGTDTGNDAVARRSSDPLPDPLTGHSASRQPAAEEFDASVCASNVIHQLNTADKAALKALAPELGRQLNAAMKDEDRNRLAQAAGILLGLFAWAGHDGASLKRFVNAMGSAYTFEHVLDSAQYFARLDEASPHLKLAAVQLARAQHSWDRVMSAGAFAADVRVEVSVDVKVDVKVETEVSTQRAPGSPPRRAWPQVDSFHNVPFKIGDAIHEARAVIASHVDAARPAGVDAGVEGLFIPPRHVWPHLHLDTGFIVLKRANGKHLVLYAGGELKGNNVHRAREYLRESGRDAQYLMHMENLLDRWMSAVTA
ncbi:hypothetical protein BH11PSE7_BH11PSE7_22450 [soil metagenome]